MQDNNYKWKYVYSQSVPVSMSGIVLAECLSLSLSRQVVPPQWQVEAGAGNVYPALNRRTDMTFALPAARPRRHDKEEITQARCF